MSGRIIPLQDEQHEQTRQLLPWYVTARLDETDRATVEAHLGACAACRAELREERRLSAAVAALPIDVEYGWASLRDRVSARRRRRGWTAGLNERMRLFGAGWLAGSPWLRWALVGQAVLIVGVAALILPRAPAHYHALGAAPAPATGDIVVMFRPDTSERAFRETLDANHARLVGGPTASDAYLIHVPTSERPAALARLRKAPSILLAEPVDAEGPR